MDGVKRHSEIRTITLSKSPVELGMQICGGNLHGIFVMDFDEESAAGGLSGLIPGDLILEVSRKYVLILPEWDCCYS